MNTKQIAKKLLQELDSSVIENISAEQIQAVQKELNPYAVVAGSTNEYLTMSFTNLREKYYMRLLTTAMIGFLNNRCDSWCVPDDVDVVPVYDYVQNESLLDDQKNDSEKMRNKREYNRFWMQKRIIVKQFLEEIFQFDPDIHVRSSYNPQATDTTRKVITTPPAKLAMWQIEREIKNQKTPPYLRKRLQQQLDEYNAKTNNATHATLNTTKVTETKTNVSRDATDVTETKTNVTRDATDDTETATNATLDTTNATETVTNVSRDATDVTETATNVSRDATDVTQNVAREPTDATETDVTENVAREPTDVTNAAFTSMIAPEDTFYFFTKYLEQNYEALREVVHDLYGDTPDFELAILPLLWSPTLQESEQFKREHCKEFITDVVTLGSGKWNLIGPFKECREKIEFYGQNSHILQQMLNNIERDSKMAEDLLKKKVRVRKIKNIIENGYDHKDFKNYKRFADVSTDNDDIKLENDLRSYRAIDPPDDSYEIPVMRINNGVLERDFFYSKEKLAFPPPDSAKPRY